MVISQKGGGQWKQHRWELICRFNKIKGHIDNVLSFLCGNLDNPKMYYIEITPRCCWGDSGRRLGRWIDFYVLRTFRKKYHIMEIWTREVFEPHYKFDEQVMFGMLKTDLVHYNGYGNIALTCSIMRCPLLNKWRLLRENEAFLAKHGIKLP